MYIAIEGIDGAGKTTQIDLLKVVYGEQATFIKEPGQTPLGAELRKLVLSDYPMSELTRLLLFLADRAETCDKYLNGEGLIISDRSVLSALSYSSGVKPASFILECTKLPEKVILLEISRDVLLERLSGKKLDAIESRGIEYLLEVQASMKYWIEHLQIPRLYIDATLERDVVHQKIIEYIQG